MIYLSFDTKFTERNFFFHNALALGIARCTDYNTALYSIQHYVRVCQSYAESWTDLFLV